MILKFGRDKMIKIKTNLIPAFAPIAKKAGNRFYQNQVLYEEINKVDYLCASDATVGLLIRTIKEGVEEDRVPYPYDSLDKDYKRSLLDKKFETEIEIPTVNSTAPSMNALPFQEKPDSIEFSLHDLEKVIKIAKALRKANPFSARKECNLRIYFDNDRSKRVCPRVEVGGVTGALIYITRKDI